MAYNVCGPSGIFGPLEQVLFLGSSVQSFTANAGYNTQVSELVVKLVTDPCAAKKVYYNNFCQRVSFIGADPGFFEPTVGAPVYFRVGEFEFSGLIQSWTRTNSLGGNPTYDVQIVDPRQILEGTQIIIGSYAGSVVGTPNVINVFGYMESFGVYDPQTTINGATFGTPGYGFGGAYANDNGMLWNRIRQGLMLVLSSQTIIANQWSPYGRLVFRGSSTTSVNGVIGCGLIDADVGSATYYLLDISELPWDFTGVLRISGTSIGLLELISQVCTNAGCDYYIELVYVPNGAGIVKFIKVRVISRAAIPVLGAIDAFIGSSSGLDANTQGYELRSEVTSSFMIGGNQQTIYQAFQDTNPPVSPQEPNTPPDENRWIITPFWGTNILDGEIIPTRMNEQGYWEFYAPTYGLNQQIFSELDVPEILIDELELQMALAGMDSWLSWIAAVETESWNAINFSNTDDHTEAIFSVEDIMSLIIETTKLAVRDIVPGKKKAYRSIDSILERDLQTIYTFIHTYATEYYGKQFSVRLPYTAVVQDLETGLYKTSEEPSDGGWTDAPLVIGLPHPSVYTDFFTLDDNRLGAFVAINVDCGESSKIDATTIGADEYGLYDGYIYVKASVDPKLHWLSNTPRVIVTLPQQIMCLPPSGTVQKAQAGLTAIVDAAADEGKKEVTKDKLKETLKQVAGLLPNCGKQHVPTFPYAVAIPLKSNIATYGDNSWANIGAAGVSKVEVDENLTPWSYGSTAGMVLAGYAKANQEVTQTQAVEQGTVTVAGVPRLPLGAEIGSYNGLAGRHLFESRTLATSGFAETAADGNAVASSMLYTNIMSGGWVGIYGPNISQINVDVSTQQITTQYVMRTFTSSFGKLAKYNSERIKAVGLQQLKIQKMTRQLNSFIQGSFGEGGNKNKQDRRELIEAANARTSKTPHEVLVGQIIKWGKNAPNDDVYRRAIIATEDLRQLGTEYEGDYSSKAFMSLDGLVRPVSILGASGTLPRFAIPIASGKVGSFGAMPPIKDTGFNVLYGLDIGQPYLNPLLNPTSSMHGVASGHDFDIIGRGETPPDEGLNMAIHGYHKPGEQWSADYRFLGLRGPLVMQSWGYDLDGKPIPNKVDDETDASNGLFLEIDLKDQFMDDWLRKSHTWPVAPVDLRYDRQRGVWTIPQFRLINITTTSNIAPTGSGEARLVYSPTNGLFNSGGNPVAATGTRLQLSDKIGAAVPSGTKMLAYYDPEQNIYLPVNYGNPHFLCHVTGATASANSACRVIMYYGSGGSEIPTNPGIYISGWNRTSLTLTTGVMCLATRIGPTWYIEPWEC